MEEIASEELSSLRAEPVSARTAEQLFCKDEQLGMKDERPASTLAELQHRSARVHTGAVASNSSKRQRLYDSSVSPLDKYDLLEDVFEFVGGGDHLYTGGVSSRWRNRYMQYCAKNKSKRSKQFATRQRSVLMTESRLQLALSSGLTVTGWTFSSWHQADLICHYSLEPEAVMTLLRDHGAPWSTMLCNAAASCNKLALLQWLHAHSCPWHVAGVRAVPVRVAV
jgi:hypothetical protein